MTPTAATSGLTPDLIDRVLKLSPAEQDTLMDLVTESRLDPPDDPDEVRQAWKDEIGRRLDAYLRGEVKAFDAKESIERVRAKLRVEFGYDV